MKNDQVNLVETIDNRVRVNNFQSVHDDLHNMIDDEKELYDNYRKSTILGPNTSNVETECKTIKIKRTSNMQS